MSFLFSGCVRLAMQSAPRALCFFGEMAFRRSNANLIAPGSPSAAAANWVKGDDGGGDEDCILLCQQK
jgi:hypothetical protein